MPEITNVSTGETIASSWGNDIRDRTVQRYADAAERATEHPAPSPGDLSYLEDTGDVDVFGPGGWQHVGPPVGSVQAVATSSAPNGWLLCNGNAVSRTTYAALFSAIGTTYGNGDGSTTFNLPDLRQRFPLGRAASGTGSTLGSTGGAINHVHTNPATGNNSGTTITVQTGTGENPVAPAPHTHPQGNTGTANPPFIALNFAIKV